MRFAFPFDRKPPRSCAIEVRTVTLHKVVERFTIVGDLSSQVRDHPWKARDLDTQALGQLSVDDAAVPSINDQTERFAGRALQPVGTGTRGLNLRFTGVLGLSHDWSVQSKLIGCGLVDRVKCVGFGAVRRLRA